MARDLLQNMNAAALETHLRMPAFRIYVYDILTGGDAMMDIVLGNTLASDTGPRDFTNETVQVTVTEVAGDYIDSGIATSSIVADISDINGLFNPYTYQVTGVGDGRWLREGNVVRILEGDARVDEDEWVWTFTGFIVGQAGVDRSRVGMTSKITFKALGRESKHVNRNSTSKSWADGTSFLQMAIDIAELDMGLDIDEVDFPNIGTSTTRHSTTQMVEEPPLISIAKIFLPDLYMPRFNGEGKLTATSGVIGQPPKRIYEDANMILSIVQPYHSTERINTVTVKGLDAGLVKSKAPRQEVATMELTTGYFTDQKDINVYWSQDHTLMAENVICRILQSVNGGLTALGGGEEFTDIPAPNSGGEGTIGQVMTIDTGFAPYLIVFFLVEYVALAAIPDTVIPYASETIPVGRIAQAAALAGMELIMAAIGKGSYQWIGEPFEYVFSEIRAEARETGVTQSKRKPVEIVNHLINFQELAHSIARDILFRQVSKSNAREVEMLYDPRLEVDDVWQNYDSRRYLIRQITRTLGRGMSGTARLTCSEVTEGVLA